MMVVSLLEQKGQETETWLQIRCNPQVTLSATAMPKRHAKGAIEPRKHLQMHSAPGQSSLLLSIVCRLNPYKHLFQESLQEPSHFSPHAHFPLFIPSIQLVELALDLIHKPDYLFMAFLPLPSTLNEALWVV